MMKTAVLMGVMVMAPDFINISHNKDNNKYPIPYIIRYRVYNFIMRKFMLSGACGSNH